MKPKAISLFSGAGGLDVGFEKAGFDVVAANEFDHDAAEAWRLNRQGKDSVMLEGDINELKNMVCSHKADIVFGGPPCQGYSIAGKMNPDDPRSKLVWSFLEVVEIVKPRVFVMENVAALGNLEKWANVRNEFVKRANELGYSVDFKVHGTSDYGVPQKRKRVIFVGVLNGDPTLWLDVLKTKEQKPPTAREAILAAGEYGSENNPQTCTDHVSLATHPVMRKSPYAGMLVNGAGRPIDLDGLPPTLPASMGGNKTPIVDQYALLDREIENWFVSYHKGLFDGSCNPGEKVPDERLRRLTIAECASIQTFPLGYKFFGGRSKQYRQIGNAVPPRFAQAIAESIRDTYFSEIIRE